MAKQKTLNQRPLSNPYGYRSFIHGLTFTLQF